VYNRIKAKKKERKKIKDQFKEAFDASTKLQELKKEVMALKAQQKDIEMEIRADYAHELGELEALETDIKNDQQVMDDIALTKYMKGESISFKDENDEEYEPVFKITYKKVK